MLEKQNVLDTIKDEVERALLQMGKMSGEAAAKIDLFLVEINPDIETAIVTGDLRSLDFIRDRIAAKLTKIGLGLIDEQRAQVTNIIMIVLRTLLKVATGFA